MNHQTRRDDLPDTPWASDELCVDMPTEIFAGTNAGLQTAKAACAHCTVDRQCLRWAITTEIDDEVWGGRTPAERQRITVAFVLDPPPMSPAPDLSRPVDPVGPEMPSEPIAEPLRRVGQGVRPKKLSSPASTDVAVRGPRIRTSATPVTAAWCTTPRVRRGNRRGMSGHGQPEPVAAGPADRGSRAVRGHRRASIRSAASTCRT